MVKHIVLWTFRGDAGEKSGNLKTAKGMLEALRDKVPGIVKLEVGINHNPAPEAFDLSLISEFATQEDLDGYQEHPEHRKVVEFMRRVRVQRAVVDYC
jgi:hypothetical protein